MEKQLFEQFRTCTGNSLTVFQDEMNTRGYSHFSKFIDGFREVIQLYDEEDGLYMVQLVEKAAMLFPKPIVFSPHWQSIWEQFEATVRYKNSVFQRIPLEQRDGEWQIILDNPFTNQEVVCYPSLGFIEAAYLYGYFRPDLKENEYVRMQKVESRIVEFGFMKEKTSVQ